MLRKALLSLSCAFALAAPAYSQDVFVPRELKAQSVHPAKEHKPEAKPDKPSEVTRKAEVVSNADSKPGKDAAENKKVAKAEPVKEKTDKAPAKDKPVAAKSQAAADDVPTIK